MNRDNTRYFVALAKAPHHWIDRGLTEGAAIVLAAQINKELGRHEVDAFLATPEQWTWNS